MKPFREMNKTVIGLVGIILILAFVVGAFDAESLPIIGGGSVYRADFSEAAGLQKQDEVRVAGVKVGQVVGIAIDAHCAGEPGACVVVKMRIKHVQLGDLTSAAIDIKTVLGRKFIMLDPAGSGNLHTTIPEGRTTSPFDVSPAFQQLASTVGNINTQQLGQAFTTLADDFRGSPPEVKQTLDGLSRLSLTISSRDAKLHTLLIHAASVTAILADRDQDLVAFLQQSNLLLQELNYRRAAIHTLLLSTTALSEQLTALVRENTATLAPALSKLLVVTDVLKANQNNLDLSLQRLAPFVRLFANNLGNGRWFDTYIRNLTDVSGFTPGTFGDGS